MNRLPDCVFFRGVFVFMLILSSVSALCLTTDQLNLLRQIATSTSADPDEFVTIFEMMCNRDSDNLQTAINTSAALTNSRLTSYYDMNSINILLNSTKEQIKYSVDSTLNNSDFGETQRAFTMIATLYNESVNRSTDFSGLESKIYEKFNDYATRDELSNVAGKVSILQYDFDVMKEDFDSIDIGESKTSIDWGTIGLIFVVVVIALYVWVVKPLLEGRKSRDRGDWRRQGDYDDDLETDPSGEPLSETATGVAARRDREFLDERKARRSVQTREPNPATVRKPDRELATATRPPAKRSTVPRGGRGGGKKR